MLSESGQRPPLGQGPAEGLRGGTFPSRLGSWAHECLFYNYFLRFTHMTYRFSHFARNTLVF